jgi:ribosome-associated protein
MKSKEMQTSPIEGRDFSNEMLFSASRSRGPGGQHVNKVNTKIELRFHVESSQLLSATEKELVLSRLRKKLTDTGFLVITSQAERSQLRNKEAAIEKFTRILTRALMIRKKRKSTRPTINSREKRLTGKKIVADKKTLRKKLEW